MRLRNAMCLCALVPLLLAACGGDDSNPMQASPDEETMTETGTSGSFSFTAELIVGDGPPATRVVTDGRFNVTF